MTVYTYRRIGGAFVRPETARERARRLASWTEYERANLRARLAYDKDSRRIDWRYDPNRSNAT